MAERNLNETGIFEVPHLGGLLFVSRTEGEDLNPLGKGMGLKPEMERLARDIARLQRDRGMFEYAPPAILNEMLDPTKGDYIAAYLGSTTAEGVSGFVGYAFREPFNKRSGVVRLGEIATIGGADDAQMKEMLGGLLVVALDDPRIDPEAAVEVKSRNPSGRGVRVMGGLGLTQVRLAQNDRGFYGQVGGIMPHLDFLGYNLRP